MSADSRLESVLNDSGIAVQFLRHAPGLSLEAAAQTHGLSLGQVLAPTLVDGAGRLYMAIRAANQYLDPAGLAVLLNTQAQALPARHAELLLEEYDARALPAIPHLFKAQPVVDLSLRAFDRFAIQTGQPDYWLLVTREEADRTLWREADWGQFARVPADLLRPELDQDPDAAEPQLTRLHQRVSRLRSLPALPDFARRVLELQMNPFADAEDLARIVELDPSLAAQVMAFANSAYYGYRGRLESVRDAITRVLGYDMVLNLALGICIGKRFALPAEGPLGAYAYWRHAVTAAVLVEAMAKCLHPRFQVRPGLAYLAGLLHDFGHLVMCHIFPKGYPALQEGVGLNAGLPITTVETEVLGVRHDQVGGWLLRAWSLPEELQVAVRYHHRPDDAGEHAVYARLVHFADQFYPYVGTRRPESLQAVLQDELAGLEFDGERLLAVLDKLYASIEGLDGLAEQLAA